MPQTQFKLSKADGHTRRLVFPDLPTWEALASRLENLYAIPPDKIGVSYIDNDNDEITLSSNDELQDFYRLSHHSAEVIKFAVLDLRSTREGQKSETPPNRNTFGHESFDLDDDWQRLPTIHGIPDLFVGKTLGGEGPHAFVEVVDSDVNSVSPSVDNASDNQTDDDHSTVQPASESSNFDKGKAKAVSSPRGFTPAAASTVSMVAEELSFKHPIHVYDLNSHDPLPSSSPLLGSEFGDTNIRIAAESTPKGNAKGLDSRERHEDRKVDPALPEDIEDPPLPTIDTPVDAVNASLSLSNDIATLLTSLTSVVSAHPELSEGLRNIIRNASSGAYWQVHREALSQAVTDIAQSAELSSNEARRNIEEEAGRRISEVLGRMFRSLSEGQANPVSELPSNPVAGDPNNEAHLLSTASGWYGPPRASFSRHRMRGRPPIPGAGYARPGWGGFWGGPPPVRAHTYHAHGPPPRRGSPHSSATRNDSHHHDSHNPRQVHPAPPGPPPLGSPAQISPTLRMPPLPSASTPLPNVNPPGPVPASPVEQPPPNSPSAAQESSPLPPREVGFAPYGFPPYNYGSLGGAYPPHLPPPQGLNTSHPLPPPPPPPPPPHSPWGFGPYNPWPPSGSSEQTKPSPQELRAQVEAAKLLYKAEKERYRQEREERKKERERSAVNNENAATQHTTDAEPVTSTPTPLGVNSAPEVPVQIVSNARGPYPQLEMFSVPRRHNTHLGHGSSHKRSDKTAEDLTARALSRITKRLADMGFTQSSYPLLPAQIKAQMPANGVISKDGEDNLVTTLLEELLAMSPKPAVASGSKEKDIPGAWH